MWSDDDNDDDELDSPLPTAVVKLHNWQDWSVWIDYIKKEATMLGVWSDIDPDTDEADEDNPVQYKARPTFDFAIKRTRDEITDAQIEYKFLIYLWKDKQKSYRRIRTIIHQSIAVHLQYRILTCRTIRAELKKLAEFTKPPS
ncbi:uncharacterized protein SEPMUDRAFT_116481 [Sphaerulina musiva SO2202]|uniref:Uncharacterized protein n=1 Tax=Sphaerulina musiva (strain SO2202) TaxID=692275 RepID=M3B114_SPHMS|nr:uncharacterized protein SEPMUDRAFT_116481 [Sphaerulina musiva SO2202]EMF13442.1 hypothetical protein SEPMUDRAFT_116481 [Sphaerulina musiva SO2202]